MPNQCGLGSSEGPQGGSSIPVPRHGQPCITSTSRHVGLCPPKPGSTPHTMCVQGRQKGMSGLLKGSDCHLAAGPRPRRCHGLLRPARGCKYVWLATRRKAEPRLTSAGRRGRTRPLPPPHPALLVPGVREQAKEGGDLRGHEGVRPRPCRKAWGREGWAWLRETRVGRDPAPASTLGV